MFQTGTCPICGGILIIRDGSTICLNCWRVRCAECHEIIYKCEDIFRNGTTIHGRCCDGPKPPEDHSVELAIAANTPAPRGIFNPSVRHSKPTGSWATALEQV